MKPSGIFHRVVITTGISAFTSNNNAFATAAREAGVFTMKGIAGFDLGALTEVEAMEQWRSWVAQQDVSAAPLDRISAECSLLHQLHTNKRLSDSPHVALVYSDTFGGEAAARLVARVVEERFSAAVSLRRSRDLAIEDARKLAISLGDFMAVVSEELEKGEVSSTCFAPIGGFKVMTALGYVVGCARGFPMQGQRISGGCFLGLYPLLFCLCSSPVLVLSST
jgi:hypothetical protein